MTTDLTLLFSMSASRRAAEQEAGLNHSAAAATVPRAPDPSRHSAVCCCSLCEQQGTGEQAMRLAGGDYRGFLALVRSGVSRSGSPIDGRS